MHHVIVASILIPRCEFMPIILITTGELRPLIIKFNDKVLFIDEIPRAEKISLPEVKTENIFILLYTSASAGVPKSVTLTPKNLVAFIYWYKKLYGLTENHCVGAYASFGFDADMMDTYSALTNARDILIVLKKLCATFSECAGKTFA